MKEKQKQIAELLLQINAIKLNPAKPFNWASGWNSPIYCDNRKTLSHPHVRQVIKQHFKELIEAKYPEVEGIAGVATGAIAHGMMVADAMELPFIYVRSSAKAHGMGNQVEGDFKAGQKYVVIEDLVSTGGSSLKAVAALKAEGCEVLGMGAIFTYGFQQAVDNFLEAGCQLDTLSDYDTLIELAIETGYVSQDQLSTLQDWRTNPSQWRK